MAVHLLWSKLKFSMRLLLFLQCSPSGRRQSANHLDPFKFLGCSTNGNYLRLVQQVLLPEIHTLCGGHGPSLLICSCYLNCSHRCACLVLQNLNLAQPSDPYSCEVLYPCGICRDGHAKASMSETVEHSSSEEETETK